MDILLLATGGTFDKVYNELDGSLFFKETHLPELLQLGRSRLKVRIEQLMLIDSLMMTNAHRDQILQACAHHPEEHIVITHGTDTMVETARHLAEAGIGRDKSIVLTGAMIPYQFGSSDGVFNLGSALSFVQTLPEGVYIAMNGEYFHWDNVRKNREAGAFETLS